MKRPTLSLCAIMKNEENNLPRFIASFKDVVDEIVLVDTGSTDGSVALAESLGARVEHFPWVYDFSKARQYSFDQATCDYICWFDLDDSLVNPENFLAWRDNAMGLADYWLALYDYASDETGTPVVSFMRERVINRSKKIKWRYFIHEGLMPSEPVKSNYVHTWKIKHHRTAEDLLKDKGRNIGIFERNLDRLDERMWFYYGKELFEAGREPEGFTWLLKAIADEKLAMHDRIMGIQYCCYAAMACGKHEDAIRIAHQGLQLDPKRAEYHVIIGDCYLRTNRLVEALPFYSAAKNCIATGLPGNPYAHAVFSHKDAYTAYPRNQIARIFYHMGDFEQCRQEAEIAYEKFKHPDTKVMLDDLTKVMKLTKISDEVEEVDEIVFSSPPNTAYPWDEEIAKTKGMGGSETACIEMAKWLKYWTGLPVKVFNPRESKLVADSGVEYLPVSQLNEYFSKYKPKIHISWRHCIRLTTAKTYVWGHDLITNGVEKMDYEKMLVLTSFHSRYTKAMSGVREDKMQITRNGIDPHRFLDVHAYKRNPNKFVFPSSPDRGLDRAINVLDKVREKFPDIELHVFYGFDNLKKYGLKDLAEKLEKMIAERPWVKAHGFTQQDEMVKHFKEAAIWLHPCDFIETSCITAMEIIASGCYPVTRRLGGLMDTLAEAEANGMATLIDSDCITEEQYKLYVDATIDALENKKWEKVSINPFDLSWKAVAKEWCGFMGLELFDAVEDRHRPLNGIKGQWQQVSLT